MHTLSLLASGPHHAAPQLPPGVLLLEDEDAREDAREEAAARLNEEEDAPDYGEGDGGYGEEEWDDSKPVCGLTVSWELGRVEGGERRTQRGRIAVACFLQELRNWPGRRAGGGGGGGPGRGCRCAGPICLGGAVDVQRG